MARGMFSALDGRPSATRATWVDLMRGTAIVLVVVFHVVTVTEAYSGHTFTRLTGFLETVQGLRMPLLFFLSGLLVPRSLRKGSARYINGKVRLIAYPYVIWSLIMVALLAIGGYFLAWDVSPLTSLLRIVYDPIEHLWFLAYLFLFYVIALLVSKTHAFVPVACSLVLYAIPMDGQWEVFWRFAVFFFVGVLAGRIPAAMDRMSGSFALNVLAVVSVGVLTALPVLGVPVRLPAAPWNVVVAFWFFVGLAGLVRMCQRAPILAPLAYVGRQSIVFYLAHWPIVLFSVRMLADGTGMSAWSIVTTSLAVTAAGTTALAFASERVPAVRLLFEWPPRGTPASRPERVETAVAEGRPTGQRANNDQASPGGDS
ncbi:acyltransferase [Microbacterium sp. BWT-G7]|uniref:Acyltransferase n=2 Tax=Microbacterium allomyrinae TaxID=2830666 RepID=A0A9X1LX23_9MICO|nr:acyltransferase [Microbacterium allomyrinae]